MTDVSRAFWAQDGETVLREQGVTLDGLSPAEAARRLDAVGPNRLARRHTGSAAALARQFTEPIVLILIGASVVSLVLRDYVDAAIILAIVVLSGLISFWQEHRAGLEVERLLGLVRVHADLRRDGREVEVAIEDVVPGDIVVLNAGDVVPGDCRLLQAEALQIDQAALTGEPFPCTKSPEPVPADTEVADRDGALMLGSHVVSGRGLAVVVATGASTELGRLAERLETRPTATGFETGIRRFGLMLARVTLVLTMLILGTNLVLDRPVVDSLLFSLSLAVGVTPQMLPAIVSVSLATGARAMARDKVVVRRLDAIEDFGSMDLLCTDKTGTLTEGVVRLNAALDARGESSDRVLTLAALNAGLQTGFTNPIDAAILAERAPATSHRAIDEIPYDFTRKRLSVLVDGPSGRHLVCKGAYASVIDVCDVPDRAAIDATFERLSGEGLRVLGVAVRDLPSAETVTVEDERDLTFAGFVTFMDPPKAGAGAALDELARTGIGVRMITGDNHLAAAHLARQVGLDPTGLLTGHAIDALSDAELAVRGRDVRVFAEVDPLQKERIIRTLRADGAIVGYLGDGINDAGALHQADVGISVDSAVDVAKSAAAIVLLEKDLSVVGHGVRLGRQTFANTLKYIFTTVSANFGNVASMVIASVVLPFLPLLPRQILLLNFLSDIPSTTLAVDNVDPEQRRRPQRWDIRFIVRFMIVFGLLSTCFDLIMFTVLLRGFDAGAEVFRSGWFIGSTLTELAVLMVLRTRRSAAASRPGRWLLTTSLAVAVVTVALPYVPGVADMLGFTPLSAAVLASLAAVVVGYVISAEVVKRVFYRLVPSTGSSYDARVTDG